MLTGLGVLVCKLQEVSSCRLGSIGTALGLDLAASRLRRHIARLVAGVSAAARATTGAATVRAMDLPSDTGLAYRHAFGQMLTVVDILGEPLINQPPTATGTPSAHSCSIAARSAISGSATLLLGGPTRATEQRSSTAAPRSMSVERLWTGRCVKPSRTYAGSTAARA